MPRRDTSVRRAGQVQRVLISILAANIIVVAVKLVIGLRAGSLAVLSDVVHSSVDAMNNVLGLVVVLVASRAPDEDHPYGHQKFETLGALAIVAFLSVSAFEVVKGAIKRLATGAPTLHITGVAVSLLAATLVINFLVAAYESRRGRQLRSDILLADAAHTKADIFVTLGVLSGVLLARVGVTWADPIVGLLVAAVIVLLAYRIITRSIPVLVDQHVLPSATIRSAAEAVDGVIRAYDIRSRGSRDRTFAELTIAVDGSASVERAHDVADAVEGHLRVHLQLHEIIVHVEPC